VEFTLALMIVEQWHWGCSMENLLWWQLWMVETSLLDSFHGNIVGSYVELVKVVKVELVDSLVS